MVKKENYIFLVGLIVLVLDRFTKFFVDKMELNQTIPVISNIFHITFTQNTGAGFGILKGMNLLLIWIAVIVIGLILFYMDKIPDKKLPKLGFAFILGGALGNLLDRIIFGYVIDFLDFRVWPTFNIADSFITIGAVLLVIYYWKKK